MTNIPPPPRRVSGRTPWPPAAKVTVAGLAAVFVALAVWSGGRQDTPRPVVTAGGVSTTVPPTTSSQPPVPQTAAVVATTATSATAETTTTAAPPAPETTTAPTESTTRPVPAPETTSTTSASGQANAANRPDPRLSPGVADPAVTQANLHQTICVSGYTSTVRNVPQSEKDRVYAEYGITSHPTGVYEVDHLVSLELGGSNDIKNLWPEPYSGPDNAHDKDVMENRLHAEVCSGQLTLVQGQDEIVHWWMYQ